MEATVIRGKDPTVFSQESMLPSPDEQVPALHSNDPSMAKTLADIEAGVPAPPMTWSGPPPYSSGGMGQGAMSALGLGPSPVGSAFKSASEMYRAREKSALEERQKAEAPIEDQISAELDQMGKEKLESEPLPAFVPPTQKDWQDGFQWLATLSALGGLLTTAPLTTALNNLTGMVNGITEGNHDAYLKSWKEFDANFKRAVATNTEKYREYQAVLNNHRLSLQQKNNELRLIAKKYGDEVKAAQLDMNLTSKAIELMLREQNAQTRAQQVAQSFAMQARRLEAQLARDRAVQARHAETVKKAQDSLRRHYVDQVMALKKQYDRDMAAAVAAGDKAKQREVESRYIQSRNYIQHAYTNLGVKMEESMGAMMGAESPDPPEGVEDITPLLISPEDE